MRSVDGQSRSVYVEETKGRTARNGLRLKNRTKQSMKKWQSGVQVALKEKPGGNANFRGPQKMDGRIERRRRHS